MKKILIALSTCLFLISWVNINKSDNEFVGEWYMSSIMGIQMPKGESPNWFIQDDGTYYTSEEPNMKGLTWSVKGNIFYFHDEGKEDMVCSFNKEKTKIECDTEYGIGVFKKLDQ